MKAETLRQIDLARYCEVMGQVLTAPVVLALLFEGEVVSISDDSDGLALLNKLNKHGAAWKAIEDVASYDAGDQTLAVFGFHVHGGTVVAHLVIQYSRPLPERNEAVLGALAPLAECMQNELKLSDELLAMAEELTDRYEELNLVYDTQDQASDFEETHTHLTDLVTNCLDYMKVSFAALVLRGKKATICDCADGVDSVDVQGALKVLDGQLYDWVTASKHAVVVNEVDDSLGTVLCPGLPYRVIASPVLSGSSDPSGVLIIGRTYAEQVFTNNDRNLLDVMARKASKIVQASYDSLTGLMKRSGFDYHVERAIQASKVVGAKNTLFVINIDRMQVINDTLGFDAGDMVIASLATTIASSLRNVDIVARLGGDEFGVLLRDCDVDAAQSIAAKIVDAAEQLEMSWHDKSVEAQISVGVAAVEPLAADVTTAIANAEVACAYAKERGGNGVSVFGSGDEELVRRKSYMDLVGQIQDSLRFDRFELHYQVIDPLRDGEEEVHGEILVRMRTETGDILPPGVFLPAAERYHLMPALDRWVVSKTIEQIRTTDVLTRYPDMLVSINLSGQTLSDTSFVEFVLELLDNGGVPATNLCFEITETTAIGDLSHAQAFIATFRERDVRFSLDDFGTGLSSFSYLKELPVDYLKIDGSFVKEICSDQISRTMVSAINQVGHAMNLRTIGEFVENDAIRQQLRDVGVDYGQGYGIAKPTPFAGFLAGLLQQPQVRDAG